MTVDCLIRIHGDTPAVATVWLNVRMWTGLRGNFHQFTDVASDAPDPAPTLAGEWQQWAAARLGVAAQQDAWQPGRYAYDVERRDDEGRTVEILARGQWQWNTPTIT